MQLYRRSRLEKYKNTKSSNEGRWCVVISGRLPFPIECQFKRQLRISECVKCSRFIDYTTWKKGGYAKITKQIKQGHDLITHPQIVIDGDEL